MTFELDGANYEVDLNDKNADELKKFLGRYIEKSRQVGGRRAAAARRGGRGGASKSNGASTPKRDPEQTKAIREWAKGHGHKVSDRGRISAEVVEAYEAAH